METLTILLLVLSWLATTLAAGAIMETAVEKLEQIKKKLPTRRSQFSKVKSN